MFSKKEFGIISNLRFISMKNSLSWAWKKFYNLRVRIHDSLVHIIDIFITG